MNKQIIHTEILHKIKKEKKVQLIRMITFKIKVIKLPIQRGKIRLLNSHLNNFMLLAILSCTGE